MPATTLFVIATALAMDAFAVATADGAAFGRLSCKRTLKLALSFGLFQALMPVAGWYAGAGFANYFKHVDHWIAFAILTVIGGKMIWESRLLDEDNNTKDCSLKLITLLSLSVATSIDALAVGFSLSCLGVPIALPAVVIGIVTFVLSIAGVMLGNRFGHMLEGKVEIAGGVILILIGLKILFEHLFKNGGI